MAASWMAPAKAVQRSACSAICARGGTANRVLARLVPQFLARLTLYPTCRCMSFAILRPWLLLVGFVTAFFAADPAKAAPRPATPTEFVVVVDPGHGGENDGCESPDGTVREKDVTLAMARQLRAELADLLPHATVVLTREDDVTMTLAERAAFANRVGADLFVSLHANASPGHGQTGYETYVLDVRASTLEAARTARRENDGALPAPGADDPAAVALRQLASSAHRRAAAMLAALVQRAQGRRFPGRVDRGVRQAPFDVLMGVRAPAVLFEAGFLDHPDESRVLIDPRRRAQVVRGLAEAIATYFQQVHVRAGMGTGTDGR
ncbi:MAG: N-acetylmuramoyl-L-alanine amidase [Deltaproteobacteria bacterium]|nr:MAG: N-acetylmuramoyl-L-alanine amidase [Deltaproteobacteria bacterium]